MKITKERRRMSDIHAAKHIIQEQQAFAQEQIREIQLKLRSHYAGLERIYAFACGERNLKKSRYTKRAQDYQRTSEDEQRLQWTVENLHGQITQLQQELFQLMGGLI